MRWTKEEREACPSTVIKNCFQYCMKQEVNNGEEGRGVDQRTTVERMERNATEHDVKFIRVGIENLLNPFGEDDVIEESTIEVLASENSGFDEADTDPQDTVHHEEEYHLSIEEELKCLALSSSILERNCFLCDTSRKAFNFCQLALWLKKVASMK